MAALSTPTIHSSIALTCAGYVTMIGGEGNFPGPGGAASGLQGAIGLVGKTGIGEGAYTEDTDLASLLSGVNVGAAPVGVDTAMKLWMTDDDGDGPLDIRTIVAAFPVPVRRKLLRAYRIAMAVLFVKVLLPDHQRAAAQLAAASMVQADAAIRANIDNTLMTMSADPTQDPGVVLRLYKLRRQAFQQSTFSTGAAQTATVVQNG